MSVFCDYDINDDYYYMYSYHDSLVRKKWGDKTIQAASDLVGDPLDSRKTRYQFHNAFTTCEMNIYDRWFGMVGYDPQTSNNNHLNQDGKQPYNNCSSHCKTMRLGNWFPFPPRGN